MDVDIGTYTRMGFDEAVEATRRELIGHGFEILHEVDLTPTLREHLGGDPGRVMILGASHARFTAAAYEINKDIALLTPCNVVIRESRGGCVIAARDPELLARTISGGLQDLTDEQSTVLRSVMKGLTR